MKEAAPVFTPLSTTCDSAYSVILHNQATAPENYHVALHHRETAEMSVQ